jgi:hypothetical protein
MSGSALAQMIVAGGHDALYRKESYRLRPGEGKGQGANDCRKGRRSRWLPAQRRISDGFRSKHGANRSPIAKSDENWIEFGASVP